MAVDDEILERAKAGRSEPLLALLMAHYADVTRIASALAGRADVARGVVRFVMARSTYSLANWRDGEQAERWFTHQTVLAARRAAHHKPQAQEDLLAEGEAADLGYVAFIRAVRLLPVQQSEAFILHHGQRWAARNLAIAMDCSTTAATMHLKAAEAAVGTVAGETMPRYCNLLHAAYQALAGDPESGRNDVRAWIHRAKRPRRMKRLALLVLLLFAAAIGAVLWMRAH